MHTSEDVIVIRYICLPCQLNEKFYSDAAACFKPLLMLCFSLCFVPSPQVRACTWARAGCYSCGISLTFIFLCCNSCSRSVLPVCSGLLLWGWSDAGGAPLTQLQNMPGKSLMLIRGCCWILDFVLGLNSGTDFLTLLCGLSLLLQSMPASSSSLQCLL